MSEFNRDSLLNFNPSTVTALNALEARTWLESLAKKGEYRASLLLGYWFDTGFHVRPDNRMARKHYEEANRQGSEVASYNLAIMDYRDGNYQAAAQWLQEGVVRGEGQSMALLGSMYEHGRGVEQDLEMAIELYSEGSEKQNPDATIHLASCVRRGLASKPSAAETIALLKDLANRGNASAWVELGDFYSDQKFNTSARECYSRAHTLGYKLAGQRLRESEGLT